jgi:hypothetical protein
MNEETQIKEKEFLIKPKLFNRPLRPIEKAYIHWYIETLKPPNERNQDVINERYKFLFSNK